jgi:hypothetical protein
MSETEGNNKEADVHCTHLENITTLISESNSQTRLVLPSASLPFYHSTEKQYVNRLWLIPSNTIASHRA